MKIFDELINKVFDLLPKDKKILKKVNYPQGSKGELILKKEIGYELGGLNKQSEAVCLFTEDDSLVNEDEIILYGKDLFEIKEDVSFARIAIIKTKDATKHGEQAMYHILESIKLKCYDVHVEGYMIRTSVLSNREQVLVSKKAIKNKLSFADIGSAYIEEFKKNKYVETVKMIFVTLDDFDYNRTNQINNLATELFRALNHALRDLKMDCRHCEWKFLCDEIDGMKTLHQKIINKK